MADVFSMHFSSVDSVSLTHHGAGANLEAAGSVDAGAMHASAAVAIGPIGAATILPALAPALSNCVGATRQLAHVHHALGHATTSAKATHIALDTI